MSDLSPAGIAAHDALMAHFDRENKEIAIKNIAVALLIPVALKTFNRVMDHYGR